MTKNLERRIARLEDQQRIGPCLTCGAGEWPPRIEVTMDLTPPVERLDGPPPPSSPAPPPPPCPTCGTVPRAIEITMDLRSPLWSGDPDGDAIDPSDLDDEDEGVESGAGYRGHAPLR